MKINLGRMRLTFVVAAARLDWTKADQDEYGADIKSAVNCADVHRLGWWMQFLEQASNLAELERQCRAVERKIICEREASGK